MHIRPASWADQAVATDPTSLHRRSRSIPGQPSRSEPSLRQSLEDRLDPAWLLLATLGMRRGELLGLRWVDVDLTSGRIAIRHTLVMVDGKPAMAEPKTAKGRRSLTLAPEVLDALRAHRAHQAAERLSWGASYTDSGLVITTEDGRPFHPETLSELFVRQAKRAELPPIRLHDLRHSVASILLARAVHPRWSAKCWATPPSRLPWTPTATSSHRCSKKRRVSWPPPSSALPQTASKGQVKPSRPAVDRTRRGTSPRTSPSHVASAIGASTPSGLLATPIGRTPLSYDPRLAKPGDLGGATVWASIGSSARWRWPQAPA